MEFEIYTPIYIVNRGVVEVSTEHIYVLPVYILSWYKYTSWPVNYISRTSVLVLYTYGSMLASYAS